LTTKQLTVGIAYDLRSDFAPLASGPDDRFEEYDSESTVQAIAGALERSGYKARPLGGGRRLIETVLREPPDLVFNFSEGFGTRSREAHVPAVLEMLRIPFTHSDPLTLALSLDKALTKRVVASLGVPTAPFRVVESGSDLRGFDLAFPVIAKPLWEGSSMGIRRTSRILDLATLRDHLERLWGDYAQPVLVEEFLTGPEFTVAIVGTGAGARVVGVMEIQPREGKLEDFVYSLEVKRNFQREVTYHVPPKRPDALVRRATEVALQAYRGLECRDVARVDLRASGEGEPNFIEVNPLPGLDPDKSDIVILSRGAGVTFDKLISDVVESARERYRI
jgi:D-alanine-D-alanine ligase